MTAPYGPSEQDMVNPVNAAGLGAAKVGGIIVIGSLAFLIAVRMGFRGVSISGATGGLVK